MRRDTPIPLSFLLTRADGPLRGLVRHAARLQRIEAALARFVGTPASRHVRVANAANGLVTLHVDSPAWSTKVRFLTPRLIDFLAREPGLEDIHSVRVRVRPKRPDRSPKSRPIRLSADSAAVIESVASAVESEPLRRVLRRLSTRI